MHGVQREQGCRAGLYESNIVCLNAFALGTIPHVLHYGIMSHESSLSQNHRGMLPSSFNMDSSIALVVSRDAKRSYLKRQGSSLQPTAVYRTLAVLHFSQSCANCMPVLSQLVQCLH